MQSFQSTLSAQMAGVYVLVSTSIVLSGVFCLSSKTVSSLSLRNITARHDFVQVKFNIQDVEFSLNVGGFGLDPKSPHSHQSCHWISLYLQLNVGGSRLQNPII